METRAVHLPIDMFKTVSDLAKVNHRTTPSQLRVMIEEWLADRASKVEPKP